MAIKIGWVRKEISTNDPVLMPGQMHIRVSGGIMDPLYLTVLCVDGGEGEAGVFFVSMDIVALGGDFFEIARQTLAQRRPDISWDNVILNVTHTHAGIGLQETPERTPDGREIFPGRRSMEICAELLADAVGEAWDSRSEGGIGYGYGYAVVGHSRRTVYFKEEKLAQNTERQFMTPPGYAVMYGRTNDPLFSHYEAGADHFLNLMFTFDAQKELTGIVVNVPCPSQVGGQLEVLSADYWTEVRQLVAREFGEHVFVLPQCAAAGDLAPRLLHYKKAQARRLSLKYGQPYTLDQIKKNNEYDLLHIKAQRMDIAEQILEGIRDVYSWAKKDIQTQARVCCRTVTMEIDRRRISREDKAWCEENLELLKDQEPKPDGLTTEEYSYLKSRHSSAVNRNKRGIQRYEDAKQEPKMQTRSQIVRIGDIAFATTKFELYQDFMHRLQARSPFIQTFVVQMSGDSGGSYLPTKRAIEAKGYSASMFCNAADAEGGQQWVENCLQVLEEMKEQE